MSILAEFSIFPMGTGDDSMSGHVARALAIVRGSGLAHELGPMGTCIEGEWDEVMAVIRACHDELRADCDRVYLNVKIDSRAGAGGRMRAKVASVKAKL